MPPHHTPTSATKLLHVKSGLAQTPEFQELRSAIRSLHDDSKRKLTQDYEMQRALENLFGQVQAVREGLSTLSEAFIEESGKHHQRIVQVEKRVTAMEARHAEAHSELQERFTAEVRHVAGQIADTHKTCLAQIQAEADHRQESHQALREQLSGEVHDLSMAAHSRLEELEQTCTSSAKEVSAQSQAAITALTGEQASLREDAQRWHRSGVKHTQALAAEMAHLAEATQQLDSLRKGQAGSIAEVQAGVAAQREEALERTRELAEQIALLQQDSHEVNGDTLDQVQQALHTLEQRVGAVDATCGKRIQALRDDVAASVRGLTEQREATELASSELRTALQQAGNASDRRFDALQKRMQEGVDGLGASVSKLRSAHESALGELRAEAAKAKASRDADLEIIERALGAAHNNHESSDKVLQSTIATMKELEKRCGTTAEQGDMLASSINELEHRVTVMQRALLQTQQGDAGAGRVQPGSWRQESGHSSASREHAAA